MNINTTLLQIIDIVKTYQGPDTLVQALKGVTLNVYHGEVLGLLGVNGAGKTTLSSILATLHPPTSGDVLYQGESIYKDISRYRFCMGFCPQIQNLDRFLTVRQNLLFAGRYYLLPEEEVVERTQELLGKFELTRYANFKVENLSGGNKQRLLIARALIHRPKLVIFDEPTVGLDPDIRKKLWDYILALKDEGITIILTTHYLDEADFLSDRVCLLNKGKIMLVESVAQLKTHHKQDTLEKIFLKLVQEYQEVGDVQD